MKTYSANKDLEDLLLKFDFIDTTDKRNQLKGKKEFRLSRHGQKRIYFDYINITIIQRHRMYSLGASLSENDIVIILLFFFLKSGDHMELFNDSFSLEGARNILNSIEKEYYDLVEFDLRKPRRDKLKRILDIFEKYKNEICSTLYD